MGLFGVNADRRWTELAWGKERRREDEGGSIGKSCKRHQAFPWLLWDAHGQSLEGGPRKLGWLELGVPGLPSSKEGHLDFYKNDQG